MPDGPYQLFIYEDFSTQLQRSFLITHSSQPNTVIQLVNNSMKSPEVAHFPRAHSICPFACRQAAQRRTLSVTPHPPPSSQPAPLRASADSASTDACSASSPSDLKAQVARNATDVSGSGGSGIAAAALSSLQVPVLQRLLSKDGKEGASRCAERGTAAMDQEGVASEGKEGLVSLAEEVVKSSREAGVRGKEAGGGLHAQHQMPSPQPCLVQRRATGVVN